MNSTFLLIFLLVNVFLIGALSAVALRHALAHFKPHHDAEKPHQPVQGLRLPPEVKEQLLRTAETKFQSILNHHADELSHDLQSVATQLNKQLTRLSKDVVADEKNRYQESLEELRKQAETTLSSTQEQIDKHQAELEAKLAEHKAELEAKLNEEMTAEKQRLVAQIDTKLSDAVASFLIETLGHNVDLGAQSDYLTAMLEEHKAEFAKGVSGDKA